MPTFEARDNVLETSVTTGVGDLTLAGPESGYQGASSIGADNWAVWSARERGGSNWEVWIGQYVTGPSRITRASANVLASSNAGALVNWGATTKEIRLVQSASGIKPIRRKTKSVAGAANVDLTQEEMRCDILELTGVLTGNIEVRVDATPWNWTVYNNTTGSFRITFKVSGQTGFVIPQGSRVLAQCDGTDTRLVQRKSPTITALTSGSGTYTPPAGATRLLVKMVGGGGGGAGTGTSGGNNGSNGGNTTFSDGGSLSLVANGGAGGSGGGSGTGGSGGTASGGDVNVQGSAGAGSNGAGSPTMVGAMAGAGPWGGLGSAPASGGNSPTDSVGYGCGGHGGSPSAGAGTYGGCAGGAGGYCEKLITSVAASYSYAIGSFGARGNAGTSGANGGNAMSGVIFIWEFYD